MHKHHHVHHATPAPGLADRLGQIAFYLGFVSGIGFAGGLLYLEMHDMNRGLFEALATNSGITFSLMAAFLIPLALGWMARFLISGRRY
jgi:hypothetical protein